MTSLRDILSTNGWGMISLVGAGGKTNLMFRLAQEIVGAGESVLTTTTTRIMRPDKTQSARIVLGKTAQAVLAEASRFKKENLHLTAALKNSDDGTKLIGFDPAILSAIYQMGRFKWIVVEADGAAQKGLKAPDTHEPVIPSCTDRLIGVVGLKTLGKPLTAKWVFRPEIYARITGLELGKPVTVASLAALVLSQWGLFKGAPEKTTRYLFLNLAGDRRLWADGRKLAQRLGRHTPRPPLAGVIIGNAIDDPEVLEYYDRF